MEIMGLLHEMYQNAAVLNERLYQVAERLGSEDKRQESVINEHPRNVLEYLESINTLMGDQVDTLASISRTIGSDGTARP